MSEGENGWKSNNSNNEDGLTQVETCDVTFVDDEALFLERKSLDQLVEDTGKVLAAVSGTFRRYGLKLNWRPGKSEILVSLRGTPATKVREDKLRQADGSLAMWAPPSDPAGDPAGPMEKVCVVQMWLTVDGSLTIEMKHRAASACGALVALERTVLGKRGAVGRCSVSSFRRWCCHGSFSRHVCGQCDTKTLFCFTGRICAHCDESRALAGNRVRQHRQSLTARCGDDWVHHPSNAC